MWCWLMVMQLLQLLSQHMVAAIDPQVHNINRANLLHQVYRKAMQWVQDWDCLGLLLLLTWLRPQLLFICMLLWYPRLLLGILRCRQTADLP
jgi:hypothetical protein